MSKYFWLSTALLLWATQSWAGDVTVNNAWSRATAPGQSSAGVWFSITSKQDAKLVAVFSSLAGTTQLHTMSQEQGMMKMRAVESIALPAGKTVELAPGGNHVMLLDLKQPLKAGDSVPLKLTIELADKSKKTVEIKAEVKPLTGMQEMEGIKGMEGMQGMQHGH